MMFIVCLVLLVAYAEARSCEAPVEEIRLQPSQSISNALVSENYPDNYPDNACQKWHIVLEGPNRVSVEPPYCKGPFTRASTFVSACAFASNCNMFMRTLCQTQRMNPH